MSLCYKCVTVDIVLQACHCVTSVSRLILCYKCVTVDIVLQVCHSLLQAKRAVVLTARVHPGETNSSWMMKGLIDFLTSNAPDAKVHKQGFVLSLEGA